MKITAIPVFSQNKMNNSQPIKPPASFGGHFVAEVRGQLKDVDLSRKTRLLFYRVAGYADREADRGQMRPKAIVRLMVEYVAHVENLLKQGKKLKDIYKEAEGDVFRRVVRDMKTNEGVVFLKKDDFVQDWKLLGEAGSEKGINSATKKDIPKNTDKIAKKIVNPVTLSVADKRNIVEFLAANWKHGTSYRKLSEFGSSPLSWITYWAKRLVFHNHYDNYNRMWYGNKMD